MKLRHLAIITGISYLVIFFAAIFANFFVLEALKQNPLDTIIHDHMMVRFGIVAFMITVFFDVVVAWGLFELYKNHIFTRLSTYFRLMHAAIFGVAVYALALTLNSTNGEDIQYHVNIFNTIWLIGLFFFGFHLILLAQIMQKPKLIAIFLVLAGIMYMADTGAHFLLPDYDAYTSIFLALVAVPSILGEMAFAIWLLVAGGKNNLEKS